VTSPELHTLQFAAEYPGVSLEYAAAFTAHPPHMLGLPIPDRESQQFVPQLVASFDALTSLLNCGRQYPWDPRRPREPKAASSRGAAA